ncbi:hypothetical protein [Paenibacillus sp. NPDC058174]|uniref:hypothetical protein n=1 Tax=Paenibacillus sp. NPDC058174 TaxID=3346366 RepID=UPI0036DD06A3
MEPEPEVPFADEVQEQSAPEESAPEEEAPPKKKKKGLFGKIMDGVQLALDVAGMIPGVGIVANVVNAGISVARGDYVGAALSMAACIPFAGAVIKGAKLAKAGMKAFKLTQNIMKTSKSVATAVKTAAAQQKILGDVITAARKLGSNLTLQAKLKKLQLGMKIALVGSLPVRRYNLENDPLGLDTMKSYFSGIGSRVVDTLMSPIEIIKMGIGLHVTAWKSDDPLKSYWEQISGFYGNLIPSTITAFKSYMRELASGDPNAWGRATFDLLTLPIAWGKAVTVASKTSKMMVSSIKNSTSKASKYINEGLSPQVVTPSGVRINSMDLGSTPNKPHVNTPEQQKKIDMLMGRDPEGTGKPKNNDKNKKEREREEEDRRREDEERRRREEETEGTGKPSSNFANRELLEGHYEKHGGEFKGSYKNADEYLQGANDVMNGGTKVQYEYKLKNGTVETRTGYVKFMGNTQKGEAKFEFVGTNTNGDITTYHVKRGEDLWKLLNGNKHDKTINPFE